MYSYFFLLSLFKSDENLHETAIFIAEYYKKNKLLPEFGVKKYSNTSGYGYGEQPELVKNLFNFTSKFPNVILGFYHFYWNCQCLTIYTIGKGRVCIDKYDLDKLKVGPYEISSKFSFKNTQIPNNITRYLNQDYKQPFERNFHLNLKEIS